VLDESRRKVVHGRLALDFCGRRVESWEAERAESECDGGASSELLEMKWSD